MIRCFKKSRRVLFFLLALTLALAALIAARRAGGPPGLQAAAVVSVLLAGGALSFFAANMTASVCEHALLAKLHLELDPRGFVEEYAAVVGAMKIGSAGRVIAAANLADGFCALGEWERALDTMEEPGEDIKPRRRAALTALVLRNRCRFLLSGGRADEAADALDAFLSHIASIEGQAPALAASMRQDAELYSLWLSLLSGGTADMAELEGRMAAAPAKLGKLDVCAMLILAAANAGDGAAEERFSRLFAAEGGGLAAACALREKYPAPSVGS